MGNNGWYIHAYERVRQLIHDDFEWTENGGVEGDIVNCDGRA
jgi:hypothetical protein